MKLKLELELNEMQEIYDAAHVVADELGCEASEDIFVERSIDLTAVKVQQNIGEIEVDIDSDFLVWMIKKVVEFAKFIKPVVNFIMKWCDELSAWIHEPSESDEEEKTEFDV